MKGLELPINMIIVIAIAVLVLVVVAAFFTGAFGGDTNRIRAQSAFNAYCGGVVARGCPANAFQSGDTIGGSDIDGDPLTDNTIDRACGILYGNANMVSCQQQCCTTP